MLVLVFGALLTLVKPDPAPAAVYEIWGYGNTSCGSFMQTYSAHERGTTVQTYTLEISWMQGFLTAQNADWAALMAKRIGSQNVKPQSGLFFGPDVEALGGWVNAYCNAHPLTTLSDAAVQLSKALLFQAAKRMRINPPGTYLGSTHP